MKEHLKLEQAQQTDESIKYRNLIGEFIYVSQGTRPDISYSVNYQSRFQNCYDKTHHKYRLRSLRYLYQTKNLKLENSTNGNCDEIDCFVDSDVAGDNNDRRSTSGFVIRMYNNLIFWKSRKQNVVTNKSTFAEYITLSEAVTKVLFIKNLCNEMLIDIVKIYSANN